MAPHQTDAADAALDRRLALLRAAAAEAGSLALSWFRRDDLAVERKSDDSPVTQADRACESLLREAIRAAFPDDGLLGEEHGAEPGTSGFTWIIDPIDGTVSFARGVPLFGTLVAIERHTDTGPRVVAGICELPALGERVWAAEGRGAWWERAGHDPVQARVSPVARLAEALVGTTGYEYFHRAGSLETLDRLHRAAGRIRGWSDCYALALAATGRCDAVVEPWMNPWDSGPFPVIFAEAGGVFTDWEGHSDLRRPTAVAANPLLHRELLRLLAEAAR
jgi:histidinol phosphatase-like enzyme (inositol monophosphatase family)